MTGTAAFGRRASAAYPDAFKDTIGDIGEEMLSAHVRQELKPPARATSRPGASPALASGPQSRPDLAVAVAVKEARHLKAYADSRVR